MGRLRFWLAPLFALLLVGTHAMPAAAQATRTWVSGVGDDANPCSRTAPCKTFAGAISKTAAGGEINCIDPGGFGALTITKSIAIICDDVEAGVLVSGTNGFVVNAGAADIVYISGLDFQGLGSGLNGIRVLAGATLTVQNCVIRGFNSASGGYGIQIAPTAAVEVFVLDTTLENNGAGAIGGGIAVQPTGAGSALVSLLRVNLLNNRFGLRIDGTGGTGAIYVAVSDSLVSGNSQSGINSVGPASGAPTVLNVNRTLVTGNSVGLNAAGATTIFRIGSSVVAGNNTGAQINSGATLTSYGNNQIDDNTSTTAIPTSPLR